MKTAPPCSKPRLILRGLQPTLYGPQATLYYPNLFSAPPLAVGVFSSLLVRNDPPVRRGKRPHGGHLPILILLFGGNPNISVFQALLFFLTALLETVSAEAKAAASLSGRQPPCVLGGGLSDHVLAPFRQRSTPELRAKSGRQRGGIGQRRVFRVILKRPDKKNPRAGAGFESDPQPPVVR